jgi:hypothetical protein
LAHGDPIKAKEIYEQVDQVWFERAIVWKLERQKAKIPDSTVGMFAKE